MNDNLPPLPELPIDFPDNWLILLNNNMREYGQLCRQQALEEAAKVADLSWVKDPCVTASDAIRSLK